MLDIGATPFPCSVRSYADHLADSATVAWAGGAPWRLESGVLMPLAMPHTLGPMDRREIRGAMRWTGAKMALWNDAWDTAAGPWWWVCADRRDYDSSQFKKNMRHDLRLGLANCAVRRLELAELAEQGYPVYLAAFSRYGTTPSLRSREAFVAEVTKAAQYAGREMWGAFLGPRLVAFASCIVIDDAVAFSWAKADPEHLKSFPNHALYYELTKHYLRDRGLRYVADGVRALRHATQMQDFLEKLGYRKVYCPARVEMSPVLAAVLALRAHRWGPSLGLGVVARGLMEKLRLAAELAGIASACRALPAAPVDREGGGA